MTSKLLIVLGDVTLPVQATLVETTKPNETDVQTLDGSLHTDFVSIGRSWSLTFPPLCRDDYDAIYSLYRSQYTSETYLSLICTVLGIDTMVKANIGDRKFYWNGDQLKDFALTLQEAYALS